MISKIDKDLLLCFSKLKIMYNSDKKNIKKTPYTDTRGLMH